VEAMVQLGLSNSRMKDFTEVAIAARRTPFDGSTLTAAIQATFRRRGTQLPGAGMVALSEQFVEDDRAQANWKAYVRREGLHGFDSLAQLVVELRAFLVAPLEHARTGQPFTARWTPGGPSHGCRIVNRSPRRATRSPCAASIVGRYSPPASRPIGSSMR